MGKPDVFRQALDCRSRRQIPAVACLEGAGVLEMKGILGWVRAVPRQSVYIQLLIFVNFLGALYGFYWYRYQLGETPVSAWPVVPDSPLACFYLALALVYLYFGRRNGWLEGLAYMGLMKYGVWTAFIIGLYWIESGNFTLENVWLFSSHLGMAAEALVFWLTYPVRRIHLVPAAAWFIFNDYADYGLGLHPYLPSMNFYPAVVAFSVASTFLILAFLYRGAEKRMTLPSTYL